MKRNNIKLIIGIVLACLFVAASLAVVQPSHAQRAQADIKVTYKSTLPGGMEAESSTLIKGARERSEQKMGYGMDSVTITQCDLKQTIQLSDKTRKYIITPMESDDSASPTAAPAARPSSAGPARRGGVITSVITSTDTGERKADVRLYGAPCEDVDAHGVISRRL